MTTNGGAIEGKRESIRKHTLISAACMAFSNVANLVTGYLLATHLGPAGFGRVSFVLATTVLLSFLGKLGLDAAIPYFYGRYSESPAQRRALVSYSLCATTATAIALATGVYAAGPWLGSLIEISGFAADKGFYIALLPALCILSVASGVLTAQDRSHVRAVVFHVVLPAAFLGLVAYWTAQDGDYRTMLGSRAASFGLAGVTALVLVYWKLPPRAGRSRPRLEDIREWQAYGAKLILASGLVYLAEHLDVVMLAGYADERTIGVYAAAARVAIIVLIGGNALALVLAPRIARLQREGRGDALREELRSVMPWLAVAAALVAGALIALYRPVVVLIGTEYSAMRVPLIVLSVAYLFGALSVVGGTVLTMTGHASAELRIAASAAVVNLVGNLALIPVLGASGAAIATAASFAVALVLRQAATRRATGVAVLDRRTLVVLAVAVVALTATALLPTSG
jgi:O-antigen/teichoic acid export membrane protein